MSNVRPLEEPFTRFGELFEQAKGIDRSILPEPTAFALATVDAFHRPSVRIVLLKAFDTRGFVFYTNYESRKGMELRQSIYAAMCFHWQAMERQVRVEGVAGRVSTEEADAYFASRPRGSQIGAWASLQSEVMENPGDLQRRIAETEERFAGRDVTRPPHWSGFRIDPTRIEFWHNMPSRLHERIVYIRSESSWRVEMLYP